MVEKARRLFVALPLPPEAVSAVVAWQRRVGLDRSDLAWERPERLHVTLAFLGATGASLITPIGAALGRATRRSRLGQLHLGVAGGFPSRGEPHTIWLAVAAPDGWLDELQGIVAEAMWEFGARRDDRPFHAHVTAGRVRRGTSRPDRRRVGRAVHAARPPDPVAWTASRVVLFESVAGAGGPKYLEVASAP